MNELYASKQADLFFLFGFYFLILGFCFFGSWNTVDGINEMNRYTHRCFLVAGILFECIF